MHNYKEMYDTYWSRSDRWGSHSFSDSRQMVEEILSACGVGKILDVGCGMGLLIKTLLRFGVDAYGMDVASRTVIEGNRVLPERFTQGSILEIPFPDHSFHTVVSTDCLEHIAETDIPKALTELYRVSQKYVYVRIATTADRDNCWHLCVHDRAWWEEQFFAAGFRKHPSYYKINDYESLERDGTVITIVLEKIPQIAVERYPLHRLKIERELHTDMLRETGRRSDAHVMRYHVAAQLIRPGDVVLDIACGLGYGLAVLQAMTPAAKLIGIDNSEFAISYAECNYGLQEVIEFQIGDAEEIGKLEDNSVDFVTSFETLEHLHHPEKFLEEIHRILKPSGRIIVSVPNDWSDESGEDPNPHHHHVYKWERLYNELSKDFLVEKAYGQVAGGGMKLTSHPRQLREVELKASAPHEETEWYIMVAMKNPVLGKALPYVETVFPGYGDRTDCNVVAFERDYLNPWLLKGMISIGFRNQNKDRLIQIVNEVLKDSPEGSVDQGAALCVNAYLLLECNSCAVDINVMIKEIERYMQSAQSSVTRNSHTIRWEISLIYVKAQLLMKIGLLKQAQSAFVLCAEMDALEYSPLLMTKTVDACFWAGFIALQSNEKATAERYWQQGVEMAQKAFKNDWTNIWGLPEKPLEFGLKEAATIIHKASKCGYALNSLKYNERCPGLFWSELKRDWDSQFKSLETIKKNWYEPEITRLNHAVQEYEQLKKSWYEPEIARLNHVIQEYEQLKKSWYEPEITRLNHAVQEYEQLKKSWYEPEIRRLSSLLERSRFVKVKNIGKRILNLIRRY